MGTHSGHKVVSDKLFFSIDASNSKTVPGDGTLKDMSNRKHTVSNINGTKLVNSYPANKFVFDGVDDRIDTNITGRIDSADGFSVETWFRGTKAARNHMWDFGDTSGVNLNCNFNDGPYALWFYWEGSGSNNVLFRSADGWNFTDGTLKHLVFTHTGTDNKVYLNGVEITPYTKQGTQTMSNVNATGYYRLSGNSYKGDVYVNRIYKKALSADEVYNNFRADKDRLESLLEDLIYDPVNNSNGWLFTDYLWTGDFGGGNTSGVAYNTGQYIEKTFTVNDANGLIIDTTFDSTFTNRNIRLRVIEVSSGADIYSEVLSWAPSGVVSFSNTVDLGGAFTGDLKVRYQYESTYVGYHSGITIRKI